MARIASRARNPRHQRTARDALMVVKDWQMKRRLKAERSRPPVQPHVITDEMRADRDTLVRTSVASDVETRADFHRRGRMTNRPINDAYREERRVDWHKYWTEQMHRRGSASHLRANAMRMSRLYR